MLADGRRFRRSGLDAAVDAIGRLPGPAPAKYLTIAAVVVGVVHLVAMIDGSQPWGTVSLPLVSFGVWPAYVLAAKAYVRASARRAIDALRPTLTRDPGAADDLGYRLSTQPALPSAAVGAAFLLASVPSTFLDPHYVATTGLFTSPLATAVESVVLVVSLWLTGAAGFGILHTLSVIDDAYVRHVRIDVLAPQNLFALARLAMRVALVVLLMQYVFVGANPGVLASRAVVGQLVAWQALALALFLVPLWNAHRLLADARAELARELGLRFERAARALNAALDTDRLERASELKDTLLGLEAARGAVARASTWPWEAETPRLFVSALLLPVVAWVVQQGLERLFG
jgi:hypothetical protein